jgi:hypothetical protein
MKDQIIIREPIELWTILYYLFFVATMMGVANVPTSCGTISLYDQKNLCFCKFDPVGVVVQQDDDDVMKS